MIHIKKKGGQSVCFGRQKGKLAGVASPGARRCSSTS